MVKKYKQRSDIIDITGQKFGKLTAIKIIEKGKYRGAIWLCQCDCGKECKAYGSQLRFGTRISCGCKLTEKTKQTKINQLFNAYKRKSLIRGHSFNLSKEYFTNLIFLNCTYCNETPNNKLTSRSYSLLYNGIDRIDSSKGYEENNCVSCCRLCNQSKSILTVDEWKNHIRKVAKCLNLIDF